MRRLLDIVDGDLKGERHWIEGFGSHVQLSYGPWTYSFEVNERGLSQISRRERLLDPEAVAEALREYNERYGSAR